MTRFSDEDLAQLLYDLESDRVERKESFAGDSKTRGARGCLRLRE